MTQGGGGTEVLWRVETQDAGVGAHTQTHTRSLIALSLKSHIRIAIHSISSKSTLVRALDDNADIVCRCVVTDKEAIHKCIFITQQKLNHFKNSLQVDELLNISILCR